ncbi:conserved hypothetical protein [Tenacibaculum litopenaei]|uniref:carboxypeptidase-like regulatory domain-containing protein n=1 Tax=Tenacibaculum litopenaei TaxID=396016 RepID=UPI003895901D
MMKKHLEISNPCREDFDSFTPTKQGGYCTSCSQEVIDFSAFTNEELDSYFERNNTDQLCGRFKQTQLQRFQTDTPRSYQSLIAGVGLVLGATLLPLKGTAQESKTLPNNTINELEQQSELQVNGTVVLDNDPMPGVTVLLKGSTLGTETDFDGNFTFPKALHEGDILEFSLIGLKTKQVVIKKGKTSTLFLKVTLKNDEVMLLGKVAVKQKFSPLKNR